MTSKEIIKRLISHDAPPRFGFDFAGETDFIMVGSRRQINVPPNPYAHWGDHPELKALTGFSGETFRDFSGNLYGRFNGKTKGEYAPIFQNDIRAPLKNPRGDRCKIPRRVPFCTARSLPAYKEALCLLLCRPQYLLRGISICR